MEQSHPAAPLGLHGAAVCQAQELETRVALLLLNSSATDSRLPITSHMLCLTTNESSFICEMGIFVIIAFSWSFLDI